MRREKYYDVHENVWRSTTPFGIVDDGVYPDFKKHRLRILSAKEYREFDLINFCREFEKEFGTAPNVIKGNTVALKSISETKYNEINQTFEIAEFKMKVDLAPDDYRDNFLEISYRESVEDKIIKMKNDFKKNELYQQSSSVYKDFQFEQFSSNGKVLEGQHSKEETINGRSVLVIFNFKNGLIHSENDLPAIEYPMHWEYWNNGLITKVVDKGGEIEELWKNGVPVEIKRNLLE